MANVSTDVSSKFATNTKTSIEAWVNIGGKDYRLQSERVKLGRATDNDIVLDHPSVSRYHAELVFTDEGIFLEDLQSRNGIRIRGQAVQRAQLLDKQRFEIGDLPGLFFQKHFKTAKNSGATEDTAVVAAKTGLQDRFSQLEPRKQKMIIAAACLIFLVALVRIMGSGENAGVDALSSVAQAEENPCSVEKLVKEDLKNLEKEEKFNRCQEHEDLGNYRLARACFSQLPNTRDVCDSFVRVKSNQEALSKLRYEEGTRAFLNYYFDLAILKWQQVLLVADDGSEYRELSKQGIEEAKAKKTLMR